MPISGTIPNFDLSTSRLSAISLVTVTGAQADGQANGTFSNETIQEVLTRAVAALSISGTLAVSGVSGTLNGQVITSGQLSGLMNLQRELAMRVADLEFAGAANGKRLQFARDVLTGAGGETQFSA